MTEPQAADAVAILRTGGLVVLPTDTVYGLAALPRDAAAMARLFAVKQRSADVPIAVLCAGRDQALAMAGAVSDEVTRIADRLWPGPLTLVLPRREGLGLHIGEPASTIGLRCPDHAVVRELATEVGPLATTSANRHGRPTHQTAGAVEADMGAEVDLIIDGGRLDGAASTVVDCTSTPWRVLREGAVTVADLDAAAAP